jgi:NAD(P)H dehydrogenase (quinone)
VIEVVLKRVPERLPQDIACAAHFKLDQLAPFAVLDDLVASDAVISARSHAAAPWRRR